MAKPRKQKQIVPGGVAEESSVLPIFVRHQKLCIAINMERQIIYGHTELQVVRRKGDTLELHTGNINITEVMVDGSPAKYEKKQKSSQEASYSTQSIRAAAGSVRSRYVNILEEDLTPDLLISLPSPSSATEKENELPPIAFNSESQEPAPVSTPKSEESKLVRVQFYMDKPETDYFFKQDVFHTNHHRRWFPSFGTTSSRCSYDLEFTVNCNYIPVSVGKLLYQVVCKEDSSLKTFVYELKIPTSSNYVKLIVARLAVHPERQHPNVSHLCAPGDAPKLQCTVNCFHSLFSLFEEYLGSPFPFGAYTQVFLESEHSILSVTVGASVVTFGGHLLVDERVIDQAILTQIKLARALARQWFGVFITPETDRDDWLLEGIAGFLTHLFIKRFLGNNEAHFRRMKVIGAVTEADIDTAAPLSPSSLQAAAYSGEKLGLIGKLRLLKAVAVIQMLEKQMGPEPFRKVLQRVVSRAQDPARNLRTLSTKEFRHLANKIGNMERLVLKEFFPRWVESQGCPVLRMEFEYNKRRNYVDFSVRRSCTAPGIKIPGKNGLPRPIVDAGWPGMMNIQIHELDGVHDHPNLSLSGDVHQQLELPCHSKLALRRPARPKKPGKVEIIDDLADDKPSIESPLLWIRADPAMDYLAKILLKQPEPMWINQLEKDKDVVAQARAIAALKPLPNSFAIVHSLNNCLIDVKIFCRVRIEAAFALAAHATEATSWAGLNNLIKFYKSRCFDAEIGLPKPNNFHDFPEYFVLQAIPLAIATVRGIQGSSPPEAVEFILTILKHNDNSGNAYSDSYWLSGIIESVGQLEIPQQSMDKLTGILKQIERYLQYDRLMPSYNNLVTRSCIRAITGLALKFASTISMELIEQKISPFRNAEATCWQIRLTSCRCLMDMKLKSDGLDKMLRLAMAFVQEDPCLRVQTKVMGYASGMAMQKRTNADVDSSTISSLVKMFGSEYCRGNVFLRHHIYTILQVLAGRSASLIGRSVPEGSMRREDNPLKLRIPRPQEPPKESIKLRVLKTPDSNRPHVIVKKHSQQLPPQPQKKVGLLKLKLPGSQEVKLRPPPEVKQTPSEQQDVKPPQVQVNGNNEAVASSDIDNTNNVVGSSQPNQVVVNDVKPGVTVADGQGDTDRKEKRKKEKKDRKEKKEKKERDRDKDKDKKEKKEKRDKKEKKEKKHKEKKHKRDKNNTQQQEGGISTEGQTTNPPLPLPQREPNELLQVKQEIAETGNPAMRLESGPSPPSSSHKRPAETIPGIKLTIKRPKFDQ